MHRREPPEDEEEAFEPTPEEAEEGPEPLAPAEGDADVLGGPAWTPLLSSAGEHVKYQVAGERGGGRPARCAGLHAHGAGQVKQAPARYGVPARAHVYTPTHRRARAREGLRSNQWPGAFCACQGARFTNIYVGWGAKNAAFVPLPPPPVATEYSTALVESRELPLKPAPPAKDGAPAEE